MNYESLARWRKCLNEAIDSGRVTVVQLVREIGVSRQTIFLWRKEKQDGGRAPGLDDAEAVANVLKKTLAEMISIPGSLPGDHGPEECYRRVGDALKGKIEDPKAAAELLRHHLSRAASARLERDLSEGAARKKPR